eukprot:scaffold41226_cov54-Phaeocystis_antarctica.AAC.1
MSYCTSRRTGSAAASIKSRARLVSCPLTPCPPVGPALAYPEAICELRREKLQADGEIPR